MKTAADLRIPFTWMERRAIILERCLYIPGYLERHEQWERLPWSDNALFGNHQPVVVEYCSGNGIWICERAKENPHLNLVAVEKRFDRARKIWARLHREEIPNLFVVCGEGIVFSRYYVPLQSISQVFVNFPDPWPKLRHAKHRIIRKEFLEEVEKIAVPRGKATFVTDDFPYVEEMLRTVAKHPRWRSTLPPPHYTTTWPEEYGTSFFFDLWKKKGKQIHYLHYEVGT